MTSTYIRFRAKYLDGQWRKETVKMRSYSENRKYAKEIVEMFDQFLHKGNILGYTVELVTITRNTEYIDVIGSDRVE